MTIDHLVLLYLRLWILCQGRIDITGWTEVKQWRSQPIS